MLEYDQEDQRLKLVSAIVVLFTSWFLLSAIGDFSFWGDANSPANMHVSKYYLENAIEDTHVPNVVTAVLADYRAFDTMFETCVVFVVIIAIIGLMRLTRKESRVLSAERKHGHYHPSESLIVKHAARLMIPFMQLFALYVVAHGHYSPGGGFQGGVILGSSIILCAMAFDLKSALKRMKEKWFLVVAAGGVLIFAGWAALCMFFGGNFLDYSVLHVILPYSDDVMARSHSMLVVEIGVALTVMCGMFSVYANLASSGDLKEGL